MPTDGIFGNGVLVIFRASGCLLSSRVSHGFKDDDAGELFRHWTED